MIEAHKVGKNLWVGSAPEDPEAVSKHFDVLVLASNLHQNIFPAKKYPKVTLIKAPMRDDEPSTEESAIALKAGLEVYEHNKAGKRVLVTCQAGVNRSALIAAIAMVLSGLSADDAITRIRAARKPESGCMPLFNQHFCELIRTVDKATKTDTRTR